MKKILRNRIKSIIYPTDYFLKRRVLEVENLAELKKVFGWTLDPILTDATYNDFDWEGDLNQRRLRDAEVLGTACRNVNQGHFLEIGTSSGHGTALMAENAPQATIHTVNMPPDAGDDGEAGRFITWKPGMEEIGAYYREKGHKNVEQIYANTATWIPAIPELSLAFIDGSHDQKFVVNDASKALPLMKPGAILIFHDFNPQLRHTYPWIANVLGGVEQLYRESWLKDWIYVVKHSWMGVYRVPDPLAPARVPKTN